MTRRDFIDGLRLAGGGLALAGLIGGCEPSARQAGSAQSASGTAASGAAPAGSTHEVNLTAMDAEVAIGEGRRMRAWTFNGTVPGPVLRVRQGDTMRVNFTNHTQMGHSVDIHAARVDPAVAFRTVDGGQSLSYEFTPRYAGAFLYHCGTSPVLMHIGAGMFGAAIVDPRDPLPAAREYVLVYNEFYVKQQGDLWLPDYELMRKADATFSAFNGVPFGYRDAPLKARVGERVRFYVVNAGPRHACSFHVIGLQFDTVYPAAPPDGALRGVSTFSIAPGAGAICEVVPEIPGHFPFVNHDVGHGDLGALGVLQVDA